MLQLNSKAIASLALLVVLIAGKVAASQEVATSLRRPIALALSADGQWLYAANQRSGSISMIDLRQEHCLGEVQIGRSLSDLAAVPGQPYFLATDEQAHELIVLEIADQAITVRQRLSISPYPVSMAFSGDGQRCYITSLWSRRLTVVELPAAAGETVQLSHVLDLPLAPRCVTLVRDERYAIVADAFGGRIAIVDLQHGTVEATRDIPAHNIRGLALTRDGRTLAVAHQILNELAHSVRNDVHWGLMISNDLRWLRVDSVLDRSGSIFREAHIHPLGSAGSATADPSGIAVAPDGTVAVTLGGVGEIAVGQEHDFNLTRIEVGHRPTDVVVSADSKRAYVANTFGDSISIVDLEQRESLAEVSLGPQPELSLAERGELLFYDASLSHDRWMSCHSCHTDGHTNGLLNDNFSDASFGAPKRVLSLLGTAETAPFAWNGEVPDLAAQVRNSITHTMQSDKAPRDRDVAALVAYLHTLGRPPSLDEVRGVQDREAIKRGEQLFDQHGCTSCHAPPLYTSPATYDVGLVDQKGNRRFNPPSLLGVGQRGPYLHDNSAESLEQLFKQHRHQLQESLPPEKLSDLLAFLRSL